MRIGLSQRLEWLETRGEMRQTLDVEWGGRLARLGAQPIALPMRGIAPSHLLQDYRIDVLLLTGGNAAGKTADDPASKERNSLESGLLSAAQANGIPVLGVCHGLQIMNLHLGGRLSRIAGHVRANHALQGPLARRLGTAQVNSFHDIGIRPDDLAAAFLPVATAGDESIEAAVHRDLNWLGVMWHPERLFSAGTDGMTVVAEFLRDPQALCGALREGNL